MNPEYDILLTQEQIEKRIREMGAQLTREYAGKNPVVIGTLKGAVVFMADLARAMDLPMTMDFMEASSYGASTVSSGEIRIKKDLEEDIKGRDVLIVEDIVDTGRTLSLLKKLLLERGAASVKIAALLDKPARRVCEVSAEYVGFTIPDVFVVGFGLDYDQVYRNLPFVAVLRPEVYAK